jgi:hypothetical protein
MGLFTKSFSPTEKYVRQWVVGVLDDAGVGRDHPGSADLEHLVAEGVILSAWKSTAATWNVDEIVAFLSGQDGPGLAGRLPQIHSKLWDFAYEAAPGNNGAQKRGVADSYNRNAAAALKEIRPNYVDYARTNYGPKTSS